MERRERQAEGMSAALVGGWGGKLLHWMSLPLLVPSVLVLPCFFFGSNLVRTFRQSLISDGYHDIERTPKFECYSLVCGSRRQTWPTPVKALISDTCPLLLEVFLTPQMSPDLNWEGGAWGLIPGWSQKKASMWVERLDLDQCP